MTTTFRREYKALTEEHGRAIDEIKLRAEALEHTITYHLLPGRERSLAMTKLEEAVMWAVKGVTA